MDIFIVSAFARKAGYYETVQVIKNMKETEKTYTIKGRRIDKDSINVIKPGSITGSFQIVLLDENDIQEARETIRVTLLQQIQQEMADLEQAMNQVKTYDIESPWKRA